MSRFSCAHRRNGPNVVGHIIAGAVGAEDGDEGQREEGEHPACKHGSISCGVHECAVGDGDPVFVVRRRQGKVK
jgi:hypothetical protein